MTRWRTRAIALFIGTRLFGSFALLAGFPIYVALRGAPGVLEVGCFAWLIMPILISYYLSRTGQYERAHVLSSLSLATLVTVVAINTGGVSSFAAIWLVAIPIEAALSSSRRVVRFSAILSFACAGVLIALGLAAWLPVSQVPPHLGRNVRGIRNSVGRALLRHAGLRSRNARQQRAAACSMPKKAATGCWPATWAT